MEFAPFSVKFVTADEVVGQADSQASVSIGNANRENAVVNL